MDDLIRVRINKIAFNHLTDNLEEEEVEKEEVEEESVSTGILEDPSPSPPLKCSAKKISELFDQINELNLDVYLFNTLTIGQEEEEEVMEWM